MYLLNIVKMACCLGQCIIKGYKVTQKAFLMLETLYIAYGIYVDDLANSCSSTRWCLYLALCWWHCYHLQSVSYKMSYICVNVNLRS